MARYLTSSALIERVKNKAALPQNQITFTDQIFLDFANEEMDQGIVPLILSFHEDHLVYSEDVVIDSTSNRYKIPHRAMGNKLRELSYLDVQGNIYEMTRVLIEDAAYFQTSSSSSGHIKTYFIEGDEVVLLPLDLTGNLVGSLRFSYFARPSELVTEDRGCRVTAVDYNKGIISVDGVPETFLSDSIFDITSSKNPHKIIGLSITPNDYASVLNPKFTLGTQQIFTFTALAPGLIVDSSYLTILDNTSGADVLNVLWFDKTGSSIQPVVAGADVYLRVDISAALTDSQVATALRSVINVGFMGLITATGATSIVNVQNAGNGICVGDNFTLESGNSGIAVTLVTRGTVTIPKYVVKNDFITLTEESIVPQFPLELHAVLAQRVALRCLEALGDTNGYSVAMSKLQDMEMKTGTILDSRVDGAPLKVSPKNTFLRNRNRR